eukprot:10670164-Heterocapsa_arctica.AAC.1
MAHSAHHPGGPHLRTMNCGSSVNRRSRTIHRSSRGCLRASECGLSQHGRVLVSCGSLLAARYTPLPWDLSAGVAVPKHNGK